MKAPDISERIAGGIYGLLIGDALGVPYEFHPASEIPSPELLEFEPPKGFRRAHEGTPPGTWSDDGAQALALLVSLSDLGRLDLADFSIRLMRWYQEGYMAVDGRVFDVGVQTGTAIRRLLSGTAPSKAGPSDEYANGNGSLMRVLPLALWHNGSDTDLVEAAHQQSLPTHGHLRAQICCALYCLWARRELQGCADAWLAALGSLREIYAFDSPETRELEHAIRPDTPAEPKGSGYVVDCLRSAHWALAAGSYEGAVKAAISLGNDTDTTACVAGGIAGIRYGINGIPERWRDQLRGREIVEPLLNVLLRRWT